MRHLAFAFALFLAAGPVQAVDSNHPFAVKPLDVLRLEESPLLQWGPSSLSFSQTWSGGESRSQGTLLKEFRSVLHPTLTFKARFGLSFQPGTMVGGEQAPPRFELPEATLTWKPGENTVLRLQFQQGSLWNDPLRRYGRAGVDSWYGRPGLWDEMP